MISVRVVFSIGVIVFSTLSGYSIARGSQQHCKQLAEIIRAVKILKVQIVSMSETVGQALKQTNYLPFQSIAEKMEEYTGMDEAWRDAVGGSNGAEGILLSDAEKKDVEQMFSRLGNCHHEMQEEILSSCCRHLEDALTDVRERTRQVSKVYTSLGFLIGLCAVVLVL